MYMQCKQGFVEADRWDGQRLTIQAHQTQVNRLRRRSPSGAVVVVRSREQATLVDLVGLLTCRVQHMPKARPRKVYPSPPGWDYEWRVYVTAEEWGQILTSVALGLDYRNFKSWTTRHKPADHRLAHDIWHVAHEDGVRKARDARQPAVGRSALARGPVQPGDFLAGLL
jgi:hypothetical protein